MSSWRMNVKWYLKCFIYWMWSDIWNVSYIELRRTGIARSRVQTPLKSWLFQASIRNCLNCVHNCEDHSLLDFKIYYFFRFNKQINCLFATWYLIIPASFLRAHDFFLCKFLVLEVEWFSLKNWTSKQTHDNCYRALTGDRTVYWSTVKNTTWFKNNGNKGVEETKKPY